MRGQPLAAATLAALVLTAAVPVGAAAAPADASDGREHAPPDSEPGDDRSDANDTDAAAGAADAPAGSNATDDAGDAPTEMPDGVPGHVAGIHHLVSEFVPGSPGSTLGAAISDVTPADLTDEGGEEDR